MAAREYDHLFKLLVIGDSGVGKSSIMTRFADDIFTGTYISTIGVDFKIRTLVVDGKRIRLQIWDTAGQERFKTITTTFYRGAHGVLVVYDITRTDSFEGVRKWLQEIESNCDPNVKRILVGNKTDREEGRVVSTGDGQRLANDMNIPFLETSAKSNINIELLFTTISKSVIETALNPRPSGNSSDGLRLRTRGTPTGARGKCCA